MQKLQQKHLNYQLEMRKGVSTDMHQLKCTVLDLGAGKA